MKFQHITRQPIKQMLHAVDNKIFQNLPILREDVRMDEDIYGPSVPPFQGKIVQQKIQHVETIMVPSFPKGIVDK